MPKKIVTEKIKADIISLRESGISIKETASTLKVSISTVKRIWCECGKGYKIDEKNFRQINGYSKYFINQCGEVISAYSGRKLKPRIRNGKETVMLISDSGERTEKSIKKWVYKTWIGEVPKGKMVLSKCKTKTSFTLQDLYLGDMQDINRSGKNNKRVILVTHDGKRKYYKSIKECAEKNFYCVSTIGNALTGKINLSIGTVHYNE